jgi:hypothetical protein
MASAAGREKREQIIATKGAHMGRSCMSPLGAVVRGLVAGAVGTAAMDLIWYWRYRRGGGESGFTEWEFSAGLNDWDKVSAPGQLGKRLYEAFTQSELPAERAAFTNNLVHWGYGISWGVVYGILAGSLRSPSMSLGLPFGAGVWTTSYIVLPMAKLYKPMWAYDPQTLLKDLSAHLAYGTATAAAFALQSPV